MRENRRTSHSHVRLATHIHKTIYNPRCTIAVGYLLDSKIKLGTQQTPSARKQQEKKNWRNPVISEKLFTVAMFAMVMRYCVKRELFNETISTKLIRRDVCVDGRRRCASKRHKCSKNWMCSGSVCTWMCLNETLIRVSQSALNEGQKRNNKKIWFHVEMLLTPF